MSPREAGPAGVGLVERLDALIALFARAADQADPQPLHWMGGGDSGPDYCGPCCDAAVEEARASGEYPEAFADGGFDQERESDGPTYCKRCGCLLGYALTSYGIMEGIEHWRDPADPAHLTPDGAYDLHALMEAVRAFGSDETRAEAVAIGDRMAPFLPSRAHLAAARPARGPDDGGGRS